MPKKALQNPRRPWWEQIALCQATRKDGRTCGNHRRRPYERQTGDLVIPRFCWMHRDQERPDARPDFTGFFHHSRQED